MNLYESSEDYLERILMLELKNGKVKSIDIAHSMNFSKASVSVAMKKLKENGYINIDEKGYITLTDSGKEIANNIYDRHVTLTNILIKLGVDEEIARKDACKIEHDLSQETYDALKSFLQKK